MAPEERLADESIPGPRPPLAPRARVVLLVESDSSLRLAFAAVLAAAGFHVIEAAQSMAALSLLDSGAPADLLVTSVRMPPDTPHGFALARMARHRRASLKIVYVTAGEAPPYELETALGPVLTKPVGADTLVAEVRRALDDAAAV